MYTITPASAKMAPQTQKISDTPTLWVLGKTTVAEVKTPVPV